MMQSLLGRVFAAVACLMLAAGPALPAARIKDVASVQSGRENQLIGYGLVVGLQGTGDSMRSSPFTEQSLRAMLQNLGISVLGTQTRAKNIAAVLVTATLPPFASPGSRIDVTVGSLGDAQSLRGVGVDLLVDEPGHRGDRARRVGGVGGGLRCEALAVPL